MSKPNRKRDWHELPPQLQQAVRTIIDDAAERAKQYAVQYPTTAREHLMLAVGLDAASRHLAEKQSRPVSAGDQVLEKLLELGKVGLAGALAGGVEGAQRAVGAAISREPKPK